MSNFQHPRDEILQLMQRIYKYRMTTTSGGNLSVREPNGDIWITPARLDKGGLRRDDIVLVRADGTLDGPRRPSSELPLHQEIYRARPDVGGIVHAHPVALVAFSLVREVPNTRLFHQSWQVCGPGGFAPYEFPGSGALGTTVAASFAQGFQCVILENHGVVTVGGDLQQAFNRFETFEFTGRTIINTRLLGEEVRYLTDEELAIAKARPVDLPSFVRGEPTSAEKELRSQLSEFVRRAYRQRLFISTQGSFSVRLGEDSLLITPYRVDRGVVAPEDLVLVREGAVEQGRLASRAAELHQAIYRAHPRIGAVINAYPVNATAFSVAGQTIDTRTIPESYVVVRRPARAPFGMQFNDIGGLAAMVSPQVPCAVLENDGVLVTGADALEAFDRLEVIESTAAALINSRAIGALSPISDERMRELDVAFLGM